MAQFNLKTLFTPEQLQVLYITGTNVVIAKSLNGQQPNVAWQVFKPLQNNLFSWKEEYGIYVSTTELQNGATINQFSNTPDNASMNSTYILQPYGAISGPSGGGYPDAYMLLNQFSGKQYVTAGLYQNANVNGSEITGNAVFALPLLMQSTAVMSPNTTIYIWLQAQVISNTINTLITSPVTVLKFGNNVTDISVAYDSQSGTFLPIANDSLKSSQTDLVTHIEPAL